MCQCRYFIVENISFIVVQRQTDFFDVDCHHISCLHNLLQVMCAADRCAPKRLENIDRAAFFV